MTRRKKIIYGVCLLVCLLLILLVWILLRNPAPSPAPAKLPEVNTEPRVPSRDDETPAADSVELTSVEDATFESLSTTFAERYGSFSTESDFANLQDVIPLMSATFAAQTAEDIESAVPAAEYYGVTTRVLNVTVEERDDEAGTARVRVSTQRQEARGSVQNLTVKYQELILDFVMEEGGWKVDGAAWQT